MPGGKSALVIALLAAVPVAQAMRTRSSSSGAPSSPSSHCQHNKDPQASATATVPPPSPQRCDLLPHAKDCSGNSLATAFSLFANLSTTAPESTWHPYNWHTPHEVLGSASNVGAANFWSRFVQTDAPIDAYVAHQSRVAHLVEATYACSCGIAPNLSLSLIHI